MCVQNHIAEIFSTIFKRKINSSDNVSVDNEMLWDSLKHIELIMTIEGELGVTFNKEDISKLTSLQKIIETVEELKKC